LANNNYEIAYETFREVSPSANRTTSGKLWNALLKKVAVNSCTSTYDVCKILDQFAQTQLEIDEEPLLSAFNKFIKNGESERIVPCVRQFNKFISNNVLSNLIASLIDKNLPKEALEIANMVV